MRVTDAASGYVSPYVRIWCLRLYHGARWWRSRDYSYVTHCDKFKTPRYDTVERMRDMGFIIFVPGDARQGYVWEARLTELGEQIAKRRITAEMRRFMQRGEFYDEQRQAAPVRAGKGSH